MFDIGFWELIIFFVVALLVLGPERLPRVARTAGIWIGRARRIVSEVRDEVERELRVEEIKRSITEHDTADEMKKLADRIKSINTDLREDLIEKEDDQKPAVSRQDKPDPP